MKTGELVQADNKDKAFKEVSFKDQFSRQSTANDCELLNESQSSLIKQEQ